ncbi:MAG: sugar phosphate isomerase/epimerase [bacterium]|nr:sugar phosphate isomerase/epimerase [bacterium]
MKIGVTQIILGKLTLDETLTLCNDAGYEALELVFGAGRDPDVDMSDEEVRAVRKRCDDAGVEVTSAIAWYENRGNLLSLKAEDRENGKKCLVRSIQIANLLGTDAVLLHPGQLTAQGTYQEAWDGLKGVLKEVAPLCAEKGVAVGIENVWNKFLLSPKEMAIFVDEVGSEWIGTYLDTANMMAYGFPEHWIRDLGSRIKRVHFKDFIRKEHKFVDLMDGDTDWPTVVKELRQIGYDGSVIHEVGGDRDAQIETANRMKKIVAM